MRMLIAAILMTLSLPAWADEYGVIYLPGGGGFYVIDHAMGYFSYCVRDQCTEASALPLHVHTNKLEDGDPSAREELNMRRQLEEAAAE